MTLDLSQSLVIELCSILSEDGVGEVPPKDGVGDVTLGKLMVDLVLPALAGMTFMITGW